MFRNPIPGQLEVAGSAGNGADKIWMVKEGIYFAARTGSSAKAGETAHDEL
jgi:hypothetical protein